MYLNKPPNANSPLSKKMQKMFDGPYQITRVCSPHNVKLRQLHTGRTLKRQINVTRLKPGRVRSPIEPWSPVTDEEIDALENTLAHPVDRTVSQNLSPTTPPTSPSQSIPTGTPGLPQRNLPTTNNHAPTPPHVRVNNDQNRPVRMPRPNTYQSQPTMLQGDTVPSTTVGQAQRVPNGPYFPVEILNACYNGKQLRIEVRFPNKASQWVPITALNKVARHQFYHMQLRINRVPNLRSRD